MKKNGITAIIVLAILVLAWLVISATSTEDGKTEQPCCEKQEAEQCCPQKAAGCSEKACCAAGHAKSEKSE